MMVSMAGIPQAFAASTKAPKKASPTPTKQDDDNSQKAGENVAPATPSPCRIAKHGVGGGGLRSRGARRRSLRDVRPTHAGAGGLFETAALCAGISINRMRAPLSHGGPSRVVGGWYVGIQPT
jgi:hypothetical protein